MSNPIPHPTRHGNWARIDGELVDLDQPLQDHEAIAVVLDDAPVYTPATEANPSAGEPAEGAAKRRRKTTNHTPED